MGKYSEKADNLFNELIGRIAEIVKLKGSKEGFKTAKVINLDSHSFEHPWSKNVPKPEIVYIGETLMYDKYGTQYAFMDLPIDELAELVDTLEVI
jgi:hypothetical protein